MNVHILITVLKPERLKAAMLVFRTIRKGFPACNLYVYGNGLGVPTHNPTALAIVRAATAVNAEYIPVELQPHGVWIESLIKQEQEPFWICDSDVVFFDRVADWFEHDHDKLFAGRYEPEFWEEWTQTIHMSRLHPSLMWFNPTALRAALRAWPGRHEFFDSVQSNLIQWNWVPEDWQVKFYDTCSGLHHALKGTAFTEEQNSKFGHVFSATYADLMSKQHPNLDNKHMAVAANPELARGMWEEQKKWYAQNAIKRAPRTAQPLAPLVELTVPAPSAPH